MDQGGEPGHPPAVAIRQLGAGDVEELVTRTITGPLCWEVEHFINATLIYHDKMEIFI